MTRIALIQMSCDEAKSANVAKAVASIGEAAGAGAKVVCLQELFHNHYPCQSEDHSRFEQAEPIPGPITEAISQAAKQHGVTVVCSLFEKRAAGLYHNSVALINDAGEVAGVYRKMHIPDDPLYYEKFYFTPGDLDFQAFPTTHGNIGVCICWDQWFPEAARLTALRGAELLFYPTAIGWLPEEKETFGPSQVDAWKTMMRSHAIANGVFVAAVNRVGNEGELEFWGNSFVADPYGNVIAEASAANEEVLIADCDLSTINTARTHWPFLRDRRIDAYGDLTKRFLD